MIICEFIGYKPRVLDNFWIEWMGGGKKTDQMLIVQENEAVPNNSSFDMRLQMFL